jgi:hypothetical protein
LGNEDRLEVVVFYLDTLQNPDEPTWKLLFEGDIVGWSYTSSARGRQMSFNAIGDISIWTQLNYFFTNTVDAVATSVLDPEVHAGGIIQPGAFYPFSLFKKGLVVPPGREGEETPADITRPYELVYNIVKGMLSHNLPSQQRTLAAVNFFARWARKRNFLNRFAALPLIEDEADKTAGVFPIFQSAQAVQAVDAMKSSLATTIGSAGTIFDVLKEALGQVFFELAMIPTAPCLRVRLNDGTILGPSNVEPTSPVNAALEPVRVVNYFAKPQMVFGIPPTCNVIFPPMIASYSYSESFLSQPTRMYVNDQFISKGLSTTNAFVPPALTAAYPESAQVILRQHTGDPTDDSPAPNSLAHGKNLLVFPEEFFKGPIIRRTPVPAWFTHLMNTLRANKPDENTPEESEVLKQEVGRVQQLLELYAKYEYFRSRYERRGGAVNLAFNPYVLPGFPCVVFDHRASALDTVGYVTNVTQSLSNGSMSTAIQYSFGRTLQEMFDLLHYDIAQQGKVYGAAPLEPVPMIRDIIQDFDKAEQLYGSLLFGRLVPEGQTAAFDFRKVIGYIKDDPTKWYDDEVIEPIQVTTTKDNLSGDRDIAPLKTAEELFQNYDAAMQYVSRPICTLQEYITFLHGGKLLSELIDSGELQGVSNEYGYDGENVSTDPQIPITGATYFTRIRKLRQGPGPNPNASQVGVASANGAVTPYTGSPQGVDAGFAQTRFDWDAVLLAYRHEILTLESPQR